MASPIRIGAVSYLNTRPLVCGLAEDPGAAGIELSYAAPAELADQMLAGSLDVALLPVIELARAGDFELVPGIGIVTFGASRSVLLVSRVPAEKIGSLALDPESRSSNALARLLLGSVWGRAIEIHQGPPDLTGALEDADAAVRIGDKALFEPTPENCHVYDLGTIWTEATGLPFVFAAWAARPGAVDRGLYECLHAARRRGLGQLDRIAAEYTWRGKSHPDLARDYLEHNIRFRLGSEEIRGMQLFFRLAHESGVVDRIPPIKLAFERRTACHDTAERLRAAK